MTVANTVTRIGSEHIAVGRGQWIAGKGETRDGELWIEFLSLDESVNRHEQRVAEFMPKADAVRPEWATRSRVTDFDDDGQRVHVQFESINHVPMPCDWEATAIITQAVMLDFDGAVIESDKPEPYVYIEEQRGNNGPLSSTDLRALSVGLSALAAELDRIQK